MTFRALVGTGQHVARPVVARFRASNRFEYVSAMVRLPSNGGLAALWIAASVVSSAAEQPDWYRLKRPRIIAHRGAMRDRPENTLAAIQRAIDVGADAVELDVRMSKDGVLFLLHDPTLDRTTNGRGTASDRTMAELKHLDAGAAFDRRFHGEPIPTLAEALHACGDRIDVLLDLKETGDAYAEAVARTVREHGRLKQTTLGVHSPQQARRFRQVLPNVRQLGFIPQPGAVEAFAQAGVDEIRLWPQWLGPHDGKLLGAIRSAGLRLQLNGTNGSPQDALPLLSKRPDAILVDDPRRLHRTLDTFDQHRAAWQSLYDRIEVRSEVPVVPWIAAPHAPTFLNREYTMMRLPESLHGMPRIMFAGGEGHRIRIHFKRPSLVLAVFEYNDSGAWSFAEGLRPESFGWHVVWPDGYRGTSNGTQRGKPHVTHVYGRVFAEGETLSGLPPWWICLGIVDPKHIPAAENNGRAATTVGDGPFLYERWASRERPLAVPSFENPKQWSAWQKAQRELFRRRLVFPYDKSPVIQAVGEVVRRTGFDQQEYHVLVGGRRIFRFFRLTPLSAGPSRQGGKESRRPAIVCFMGHGKVAQILEQRDSYQHACAARFAAAGYTVFAMENVGMEPERDAHLELDRLLRLDGYGWYSLLFAHQQILLDHVFGDRHVDAAHVGVTGVSTGGLLALSAIAMDDRVRSASVQGIFGSMRVSFVQDRHRHCSCGAIPGLLPAFDLPEMALLAAPRPLHISNAQHDGFSPREARRCIDRITPLYRRAGGEPPRFSEPSGKHEYAFEPAWKFFRETLGPPDPPQAARELISLGMQRFEKDRVAESVVLFDRAARADPKVVPHLWQRGIAYYYLGRFQEGRDQFAVHQRVNPHDVENAAWHFLCVARLDGIAAARRKLLKIDATRDRRVPMHAIYDFYAGRKQENEVLDAAVRDGTKRAMMYAHLYLGLYHEVAGNSRQARQHLKQAAAVQLDAASYMQQVAKVHLRQRGWNPGS